MYLPNVDSVIIDLEKIEDYILNEQHSKGKDKAVKIRQETGLTASDVPWVRAQIAEKSGTKKRFGTRQTHMDTGTM